MSDTIWLQRPSSDTPWGFRISGGRDYQEPIRVSRLTAGSIASTGLTLGDLLLRIGDANTSSLTQGQANELIKNSGNLLQLCIAKGDSAPSDPVAPAGGSQYPSKLNQQLASMNVGGNYNRQTSQPGSQPTTPYGSKPATPYSPYSPPKMRGYQSPSSNTPPQAAQSYHSPNTVAPGTPGTPGHPGSSYHPLANVAPPPAPPAPPAPPPMDSYQQQQQPYRSPETRPQRNPPKVADKPSAVPDAVVNMAAKGDKDKKPFAYAADMDEIKQHRERVRRKLPGTKETKDITQSETYKMIHGLDAPKPKPKTVIPVQTSYGRQPRQPARDDEMTFSGVNAPESIPSKAFHRLQSMTDQQPEIDTSSIRPKNLGDEDGVSGYDEASIRYMGRNIPSKSFRMLQNMTGGPESAQQQQHLHPPQQGMPKRRPVKKMEVPPSEPEPHSDEIVDISYVGGNIPSRSFKILQQSIGQPNGNAPTQQQPSYGDNVQNPKGRTVKVVKLRSGESGQNGAFNDGATDF